MASKIFLQPTRVFGLVGINTCNLYLKSPQTPSTGEQLWWVFLCAKEKCSPNKLALWGKYSWRQKNLLCNSSITITSKLMTRLNRSPPDRGCRPKPLKRTMSTAQKMLLLQEGVCKKRIGGWRKKVTWKVRQNANCKKKIQIPNCLV